MESNSGYSWTTDQLTKKHIERLQISWQQTSDELSRQKQVSEAWEQEATKLLAQLNFYRFKDKLSQIKLHINDRYNLYADNPYLLLNELFPLLPKVNNQSIILSCLVKTGDSWVVLSSASQKHEDMTFRSTKFDHFLKFHSDNRGNGNNATAMTEILQEVLPDAIATYIVTGAIPQYTPERKTYELDSRSLFQESEQFTEALFYQPYQSEASRCVFIISTNESDFVSKNLAPEELDPNSQFQVANMNELARVLRSVFTPLALQQHTYMEEDYMYVMEHGDEIIWQEVLSTSLPLVVSTVVRLFEIRQSQQLSMTAKLQSYLQQHYLLGNDDSMTNHKTSSSDHGKSGKVINQYFSEGIHHIHGLIHQEIVDDIQSRDAVSTVIGSMDMYGAKSMDEVLSEHIQVTCDLLLTSSTFVPLSSTNSSILPEHLPIWSTKQQKFQTFDLSTLLIDGKLPSLMSNSITASTTNMTLTSDDLYHYGYVQSLLTQQPQLMYFTKLVPITAPVPTNTLASNNKYMTNNNSINRGIGIQQDIYIFIPCNSTATSTLNAPSKLLYCWVMKLTTLSELPSSAPSATAATGMNGNSLWKSFMQQQLLPGGGGGGGGGGSMMDMTGGQGNSGNLLYVLHQSWLHSLISILTNNMGKYLLPWIQYYSYLPISLFAWYPTRNNSIDNKDSHSSDGHNTSRSNVLQLFDTLLTPVSSLKGTSQEFHNEGGGPNEGGTTEHEENEEDSEDDEELDDEELQQLMLSSRPKKKKNLIVSMGKIDLLINLFQELQTFLRCDWIFAIHLPASMTAAASSNSARFTPNVIYRGGSHKFANITTLHPPIMEVLAPNGDRFSVPWQKLSARVKQDILTFMTATQNRSFDLSSREHFIRDYFPFVFHSMESVTVATTNVGSSKHGSSTKLGSLTDDIAYCYQQEEVYHRIHDITATVVSNSSSSATHSASIDRVIFCYGRLWRGPVVNTTASQEPSVVNRSKVITSYFQGMQESFEQATYYQTLQKQQITHDQSSNIASYEKQVTECILTSSEEVSSFQTELSTLLTNPSLSQSLLSSSEEVNKVHSTMTILDMKMQFFTQIQTRIQEVFSLHQNTFHPDGTSSVIGSGSASSDTSNKRGNMGIENIEQVVFLLQESYPVVGTSTNSFVYSGTSIGPNHGVNSFNAASSSRGTSMNAAGNSRAREWFYSMEEGKWYPVPSAGEYVQYYLQQKYTLWQQQQAASNATRYRKKVPSTATNNHHSTANVAAQQQNMGIAYAEALGGCTQLFVEDIVLYDTIQSTHNTGSIGRKFLLRILYTNKATTTTSTSNYNSRSGTPTGGLLSSSTPSVPTATTGFGQIGMVVEDTTYLQSVPMISVYFTSLTQFLHQYYHFFLTNQMVPPSPQLQQQQYPITTATHSQVNNIQNMKLVDYNTMYTQSSSLVSLSLSSFSKQLLTPILPPSSMSTASTKSSRRATTTTASSIASGIAHLYHYLIDPSLLQSFMHMFPDVFILPIRRLASNHSSSSTGSSSNTHRSAANSGSNTTAKEVSAQYVHMFIDPEDPTMLITSSGSGSSSSHSGGSGHRSHRSHSSSHHASTSSEDINSLFVLSTVVNQTINAMHLMVQSSLVSNTDTLDKSKQQLLSGTTGYEHQHPHSYMSQLPTFCVSHIYQYLYHVHHYYSTHTGTGSGNNTNGYDDSLFLLKLLGEEMYIQLINSASIAGTNTNNAQAQTSNGGGVASANQLNGNTNILLDQLIDTEYSQMYIYSPLYSTSQSTNKQSIVNDYAIHYLILTRRNSLLGNSSRYLEMIQRKLDEVLSASLVLSKGQLWYSNILGMERLLAASTNAGLLAGSNTELDGKGGYSDWKGRAWLGYDSDEGEDENDDEDDEDGENQFGDDSIASEMSPILGDSRDDGDDSSAPALVLNSIRRNDMNNEDAGDNNAPPIASLPKNSKTISFLDKITFDQSTMIVEECMQMLKLTIGEHYLASSVYLLPPSSTLSSGNSDENTYDQDKAVLQRYFEDHLGGSSRQHTANGGGLGPNRISVPKTSTAFKSSYPLTSAVSSKPGSTTNNTNSSSAHNNIYSMHFQHVYYYYLNPHQQRAPSFANASNVSALIPHLSQSNTNAGGGVHFQVGAGVSMHGESVSKSGKSTTNGSFVSMSNSSKYPTSSAGSVSYASTVQTSGKHIGPTMTLHYVEMTSGQLNTMLVDATTTSNTADEYHATAANNGNSLSNVNNVLLRTDVKVLQVFITSPHSAIYPSVPGNDSGGKPGSGDDDVIVASIILYIHTPPVSTNTVSIGPGTSETISNTLGYGIMEGVFRWLDMSSLLLTGIYRQTLEDYHIGVYLQNVVYIKDQEITYLYSFLQCIAQQILMPMSGMTPYGSPIRRTNTQTSRLTEGSHHFSSQNIQEVMGRFSSFLQQLASLSFISGYLNRRGRGKKRLMKSNGMITPPSLGNSTSLLDSFHQQIMNHVNKLSSYEEVLFSTKQEVASLLRQQEMSTQEASSMSRYYHFFFAMIKEFIQVIYTSSTENYAQSSSGVGIGSGNPSGYVPYAFQMPVNGNNTGNEVKNKVFFHLPNTNGSPITVADVKDVIATVSLMIMTLRTTLFNIANGNRDTAQQSFVSVFRFTEIQTMIQDMSNQLYRFSQQLPSLPNGSMDEELTGLVDYANTLMRYVMESMQKLSPQQLLAQDEYSSSSVPWWGSMNQNAVPYRLPQELVPANASREHTTSSITLLEDGVNADISLVWYYLPPSTSSSGNNALSSQMKQDVDTLLSSVFFPEKMLQCIASSKIVTIEDKELVYLLSSMHPKGNSASSSQAKPSDTDKHTTTATGASSTYQECYMQYMNSLQMIIKKILYIPIIGEVTTISGGLGGGPSGPTSVHSNESNDRSIVSDFVGGTSVKYSARQRGISSNSSVQSGNSSHGYHHQHYNAQPPSAYGPTMTTSKQVTGVIQCILYESYDQSRNTKSASVATSTDDIMRNVAVQYIMNYTKLILPCMTSSIGSSAASPASSSDASLVSLLQSIATPMGGTVSNGQGRSASNSRDNVGSGSVLYTLDYCNTLSYYFTSLIRSTTYVTYVPHMHSDNGNSTTTNGVTGGYSSSHDLFHAYIQHLVHHHSKKASSSNSKTSKTFSNAELEKLKDIFTEYISKYPIVLGAPPNRRSNNRGGRMFADDESIHLFPSSNAPSASDGADEEKKLPSNVMIFPSEFTYLPSKSSGNKRSTDEKDKSIVSYPHWMVLYVIPIPALPNISAGEPNVSAVIPTIPVKSSSVPVVGNMIILLEMPQVPQTADLALLTSQLPSILSTTLSTTSLVLSIQNNQSELKLIANTLATTSQTLIALQEHTTLLQTYDTDLQSLGLYSQAVEDDFSTLSQSVLDMIVTTTMLEQTGVPTAQTTNMSGKEHKKPTSKKYFDDDEEDEYAYLEEQLATTPSKKSAHTSSSDTPSKTGNKSTTDKHKTSTTQSMVTKLLQLMHGYLAQRSVVVEHLLPTFPWNKLIPSVPLTLGFSSVVRTQYNVIWNLLTTVLHKPIPTLLSNIDSSTYLTTNQGNKYMKIEKLSNYFHPKEMEFLVSKFAHFVHNAATSSSTTSTSEKSDKSVAPPMTILPIDTILSQEQIITKVYCIIATVYQMVLFDDLSDMISSGSAGPSHRYATSTPMNAHTWRSSTNEANSIPTIYIPLLVAPKEDKTTHELDVLTTLLLDQAQKKAAIVSDEFDAVTTMHKLLDEYHSLEVLTITFPPSPIPASLFTMSSSGRFVPSRHGAATSVNVSHVNVHGNMTAGAEDKEYCEQFVDLLQSYLALSTTEFGGNHSTNTHSHVTHVGDVEELLDTPSAHHVTDTSSLLPPKAMSDTDKQNLKQAFQYFYTLLYQLRHISTCHQDGYTKISSYLVQSVIQEYTTLTTKKSFLPSIQDYQEILLHQLDTYSQAFTTTNTALPVENHNSLNSLEKVTEVDYLMAMYMYYFASYLHATNSSSSLLITTTEPKRLIEKSTLTNMIIHYKDTGTSTWKTNTLHATPLSTTLSMTNLTSSSNTIGTSKEEVVGNYFLSIPYTTSTTTSITNEQIAECFQSTSRMLIIPLSPPPSKSHADESVSNPTMSHHKHKLLIGYLSESHLPSYVIEVVVDTGIIPTVLYQYYLFHILPTTELNTHTTSSSSKHHSSSHSSHKSQRASKPSSSTSNSHHTMVSVANKNTMSLSVSDMWVSSLSHVHKALTMLLAQQQMRSYYATLYRCLHTTTWSLHQQTVLLQELLPLMTLEGSNILYILQRFQSLLAYLLPSDTVSNSHNSHIYASYLCCYEKERSHKPYYDELLMYNIGNTEGIDGYPTATESATRGYMNIGSPQKQLSSMNSQYPTSAKGMLFSPSTTNQSQQPFTTQMLDTTTITATANSNSTTGNGTGNNHNPVLVMKSMAGRMDDADHMIQQTNGYKLDFPLDCYEVQGQLIVYFVGTPAGMSMDNNATANNNNMTGKSVSFSSPTASMRKKSSGVETPSSTVPSTTSQELEYRQQMEVFFSLISRVLIRRIFELHRGYKNKKLMSLKKQELLVKSQELEHITEQVESLEISNNMTMQELHAMAKQSESLRQQLQSQYKLLQQQFTQKQEQYTTAQGQVQRLQHEMKKQETMYVTQIQSIRDALKNAEKRKSQEEQKLQVLQNKEYALSVSKADLSRQLHESQKGYHESERTIKQLQQNLLELTIKERTLIESNDIKLKGLLNKIKLIEDELHAARGTNAFLKKQLDQSNIQLKVAQDEHSKQLASLQHSIQLQQLYTSSVMGTPGGGGGNSSPATKRKSTRSPSISPMKPRSSKVQQMTMTTTTSSLNNNTTNSNTATAVGTPGGSTSNAFPSPHFMELLQREQQRSESLQQQLQQQQQQQRPTTE